MFFSPIGFVRLSICLAMICPITPFIASAEQHVNEPVHLSLVDQTHRKISDRLAAPSQWFDNFFGDPRSDEEPAETLLRLRGSTTYTEGEGLGFDGQLKARLRLPRLKRRFHLILSSEEDDVRDDMLKDARINSELAETTDDTSIALQYTPKRSSTYSLTHRLGLDLEDGLNPQLRSRVRFSLPIANRSLLSLIQAVFWENQEGFGEESRIDYDLPFYENMVFRTTGRGLFSESSQGYEWLFIQQWLTSFSPQKALALGAFIVGETRPQNHLTEYNIFIKYRQRFIKKWLYFELKPEIYWLREDQFKATTAFTLTLEIQFGE